MDEPKDGQHGSRRKLGGVQGLEIVGLTSIRAVGPCSHKHQERAFCKVAAARLSVKNVKTPSMLVVLLIVVPTLFCLIKRKMRLSTIFNDCQIVNVFMVLEPLLVNLMGTDVTPPRPILNANFHCS